MFPELFRVEVAVSCSVLWQPGVSAAVTVPHGVGAGPHPRSPVSPGPVLMGYSARRAPAPGFLAWGWAVRIDSWHERGRSSAMGCISRGLFLFLISDWKNFVYFKGLWICVPRGFGFLWAVKTLFSKINFQGYIVNLCCQKLCFLSESVLYKNKGFVFLFEVCSGVFVLFGQ